MQRCTASGPLCTSTSLASLLGAVEAASAAAASVFAHDTLRHLCLPACHTGSVLDCMWQATIGCARMSRLSLPACRIQCIADWTADMESHNTLCNDLSLPLPACHNRCIADCTATWQAATVCAKILTAQDELDMCKRGSNFLYRPVLSIPVQSSVNRQCTCSTCNWAMTAARKSGINWKGLMLGTNSTACQP